MPDRDGNVANQDIAVEMQGIVRRASEPWSPGESVKAAIGRASRRLGLSYRRARSLWYAAPAAIRAHEADALRRANLALMEERHWRLDAERDRLAALIAAARRPSGHVP